MPSWITGIVDKVLGIWQTMLSPQDYYRRKINALEKQKTALQKERDALIQKGNNPDRLGAVVKHINRLSHDIATYTNRLR